MAEIKKVATRDSYGNALKALEAARKCKGQPTAIVMSTTKGKGVSFMENDAGWHGKAPNDAEFEQAMAELNAAMAELEG